jgi:hypothetical protein
MKVWSSLGGSVIHLQEITERIEFASRRLAVTSSLLGFPFRSARSWNHGSTTCLRTIPDTLQVLQAVPTANTIQKAKSHLDR